MNIKNKLDDNEIKHLESVNIKLEDKDYTIDDTGEIIERLDEEIHNHLDKNLNFTEKSIELEKLQDKILKFEENID